MVQKVFKLSFVVACVAIASSCGMKKKLDRGEASSPSASTPPTAATNLNWSETSPHNSRAVTATWIKSSSTGIQSQSIQFYVGAGCVAGTESGAPITLSKTAQTRAFTGSDGVTYSFKITTLRSASLKSTSACSTDMTIALVGGNSVPLVRHTCSTALNEDVAYSCVPTVVEPDPDTITWSQTGAHTCAWASVNAATGAVSGTPNDNQVGTCTIGFKANDGTIDSNLISYNVTVNNVRPTLAIANTSLPEDSGATVIRSDAQVQASDEGFGVYSLVAATAPRCSDNGSVSIDANTGALTYQPNANYAGTCNIRVQFDDQNATNNTVTDDVAVTVTNINDAPVISEACATTLNQGTAFACSPSITDLDDTSFTWSFTAADTCGWDSINSTTGALSGTPNDDQVGTCTIAFKANDGDVDSNTLTISMTINNVAPTLTIANAAAIPYASGATVIRNNAAVQASEEGYGTYALDNAGTTAPKCSDNGTVSIHATNGQVTFDPDNTYSGTCNIKVSFDDGNGGTVADEFTATVSPFVNSAPVASATCSTSATEDVAYSCTPSVTDADAGDTHTWATTAAHTCAWLSVDANSGAATGTPNDNQVGSCVLAFRASDGTDPSNTLSYTITVANVAPTLTIADAAAIAEDAGATVVRNDAAVQASDEGYGVYSIIAATAPDCNNASQGSVSIDASTGEVTYTPAANYSGTCNIKVQFNDQNAANNLVSDEFAVTVNGANDAPVISQTCTTSQNEDVAYSCTPSLTDPDDSSFTWSTTAAHTCGWASINATSGELTGTPDDDDVGTCAMAFKANDGDVDSNTLNFNVTINNVAPTLTIGDADPIAYASGATVVRADADVQASDEGLGTYTLDAAGTTAPKCSDNGSVTINGTTGAVTFDPDNTYSGTCNIKVVFDDGNASSNTVADEFTATVSGSSNNAPVASATCSTAATQGSAYSCSPSVSDADAGDTHTWSTTAAHTCAWLSVDANSGAVSGTPNDNQVGSCTLAFRAHDGTVYSNTLSYSITIANVAPTLTIADAAAINEDAGATVIRNDAAVQASEEGYGVYSVVAASATDCNDASRGTVTVDGSTGAVTYTPASNYNGTCNIKIQFDDQNAASNTVADEFAITVNSINDAPVVSHSCGTSVNQGTAYSCTPSVTDPDDSSFTWSLTAADTCAWDSMPDTSTGAVSGTPTDDQVGSCTIAFKTNDGDTDSNTVSIAVTVNNVAPTLTIADAAAINEDAGATVIRNDAAVQASEEGSGTYSVIAASATDCNHASRGSVSVDSTTGAVTYTPASNYNGTCNIKIQFDDGNASSNLVSDEFAITVNAVNDQPVISQSCATSVNQGSAYSCTPSVTDPDDSSFTWSFTAADTCAWNTMPDSTTGAIGGTPNDNQVGSCTMAIKVNDGDIDSATESWAVTINNVAPTLTIADAAAINEDAGATVIRNDAAVAASEEGSGVYSIVAASATDCNDVSRGTVTIDANTGAVTYTPASNYNGTCNIKVQFDDQNAANNTVTDEFAITVNAVNDQPVISHSCATSVNQSSAYSCTPSVTDPDDSSFTWSFTAADTCAWNTMPDSTTGAIGGTPNDGHVGDCTMAIKVNDGDTDSAAATWTVTVNNVAPTLTIADAAAINEDAGATVIRNDAAVAANEEGFGVYSVVAASATDCNDASRGTVTIDANTGAVTYTPASNYNGTCNIKVQFDDQNAANNTVTDEFAITVNAVNDQPVISASCTNSIAVNTAYSCTPSVTDPDDSSFTWAFTASDTCTWDTMPDTSTGAVGGTTPGSAETCTIAFKVNDGDVDSTEYSVSVSVTGGASDEMGSGTGVVFMSGFEMGTSTVVGTTTLTGGHEWHVGSGTWGTQHSAQTGTVASGRFALSTSGALGNLQKTLAVNGQLSVLMRVRWAAAPGTDKIIGEFHPWNGTNRGTFTTFKLLTTGALEIDRGGTKVTSGTLAAGSWYTVQVLISGVAANATHTLRVFNDAGTTKHFENSMTVSNSPGAAGTSALLVVSSNAAMFFDDIVVSAGDVVNSKTRVYPAYPNSDGSNDSGWTTGGWDLVNDQKDNNGSDTANLWDGTAGTQSAFFADHSIPAGSTIYAVQPTVHGYKSSGGGSGAANFYWENGGADVQDSTTMCVGTATAQMAAVRTTTPGGLSWTIANLNSLEAGMNNTGGKGAGVYSLLLQVAAKP